MGNALDNVAAGQQKVTGGSSLFAGADDVGMGERRVGFEALPRSEYLVKLIRGEGNLSSKSLTPSAREQYEIVEGPEGTIGRKTGLIDALWLSVKREGKDKQGNPTVLGDKEFAKKQKGFLEAFNRFRYAHRLVGAPADENNVESVTAWLKPAVDGAVVFLVELTTETGEDGEERNKLFASSMARPEDPVHDSKGNVVVGKTQVSVFREKLVKKAAKAEGRTAGTRSAKGPF